MAELLAINIYWISTEFTKSSLFEKCPSFQRGDKAGAKFGDPILITLQLFS